MDTTERAGEICERGDQISARVKVLRWLQRFRPAESKLFIVLSLLTGGLVGLAAVGYHAFLELIYGVSVGRFVDRPHDWHLFLFPVIGSIVGGFLLLRIRNARGSGLNQVRVALIVHNGYVSLRGTIGKFLISGAGIGLGLPLGPEDPAIHIGGGLSSAIGRLFSFSKKHLQQLVTVGSAAGLAAAFNTPVTAVIFTLEEVVGDINAPVLGSTILATVTAVVVRRALLGSQPLFQVPSYQLVSIHELITCAVLGMAGGLLSAGFSKGVTSLRGGLGRTFKRGRVIDLITVGGGVAAGLIGLIAPGTLGVGYRWVNAALNGQLALKILILLLVFKVIGTGLVFASGNSGGMFAPVLFMGAMLGGTAGAVVQRFFGGDAASVGTYALVGMGVTFAGIIRAPMTSVFMIFELTQDYQIMLPVMIANVISYAVANRLQHKSMFEVLTEQDGIHLPHKNDRQLRSLTVADAMRPAATFSSDLKVADAVRNTRLASQLDRDRAAIVENSGALVGVVTQAMLNHATTTAGARLGEIAAPVERYRVFPDQPLSLALSTLGAGAFIVPVVSRINHDHLLGVVTTGDALRAYGIAQLEHGGDFAVAPAAREADGAESEAQ